MNMIGILSCLATLFYFTYRYFINETPSRFLCILSYQMMGLGFILLQTILMSLLIECTVAIYSPFKHKEIVSVKRIVGLNLLIVTGIILFTVVYPCIAFPHRFGPRIIYCNHDYAFPEDFNAKQGYFGVTYFAVNIILCLAIAVGVIKALVQRSKMLSMSDSKFVTQSLNLVSRLAAVVGANYVCLLPLLFYSLGFSISNLARDVALLSAISTTSWNVLIFICGDKGIRDVLRNKLGKRSGTQVTQVGTQIYGERNQCKPETKIRER